VSDTRDEHDKLYLAATNLLKRYGIPEGTPPFKLSWLGKLRAGRRW